MYMLFPLLGVLKGSLGFDESLDLASSFPHKYTIQLAIPNASTIDTIDQTSHFDIHQSMEIVSELVASVGGLGFGTVFR
jgi:hypothetical protein